MKALDLLEKLKTIEKPFFPTSDLEKITGLKKESLKVGLSRLSRKGVIIRLSKGIFTLPENLDKLPEIANQLYEPSYLSFESVLSRHGILNQVPYAITFATIRKTKKIEILDTEAEYHQLKHNLYTGFFKEDNLFVAYPEKALLDQLYLISRGKASLSIEELNLNPINKERFIKFSKFFPFSVQKVAKKLIS